MDITINIEPSAIAPLVTGIVLIGILMTLGFIIHCNTRKK